MAQLLEERVEAVLKNVAEERQRASSELAETQRACADFVEAFFYVQHECTRMCTYKYVCIHMSTLISLYACIHISLALFL